MKPVVVLVGRPNVGKSTLFNRLTHSRAALVADVPGLTRDRQYGDGRIGDRPYLVVDTGGIVQAVTPIPKEAGRSDLLRLVSMQTQQALAEGDAIILIVDGRAGVHAIDRQLAQDLRRLGKPLWLAVNKTEGLDADVVTAEFFILGLNSQPCAISAAHGEGVEEMIQQVLAALPTSPEVETSEQVPRIAVIGKPNAGKSTLVNALLGEERVLVCEEPGTTRDSIRVLLERAGKRYILIDTAGVRRRGRVEDVLEKFSVIKTLQAIDGANVVILMIDAGEGVSEQDAFLAGYALERGRAMVLAINKWDAVDEPAREWVKRELERKLKFLEFARVHYLSALQGTGVSGLFPSVDEAYVSAHKTLPTPKLNRVLQAAVAAAAPPLVRGRRIRLKYAHQGGRNPPVIVIHGNQLGALSRPYQRYLSNTFRQAFRLVGTPVQIECRQEENPFQDKKPKVKKPAARRTNKRYRRRTAPPKRREL